MLFRRAIQEKGLDEAIKIYKRHNWWTVAVHNWNQVCNGGIALGALAIADEDPDRAEYILRQSVASIQLAMASYAPDGGWAEGPGYWQYATSYNVYYLASLQTALGTDVGFSSLPGFAHAGDFRVYFQGPTGAFSFADAHSPAGMAPEMLWLASGSRSLFSPGMSCGICTRVIDHTPSISSGISPPRKVPLPRTGHYAKCLKR